MSSGNDPDDMDIAKLAEWLSDQLGENDRQPTLTKFDTGQSNPTYKVKFGVSSYVLRRKPFGKLLPSAHNVGREFKIISALKPLGFPVPEPIALCQDQSVIGVDFYLMDYVDGRIPSDNRALGFSASDRQEFYLTLMRTLAKLHQIDFHGTTLAEFDRPGNFYERQVGRWIKQYRAAQTEEIEDVERLIEFLPSAIPAIETKAVVHGDFRIDNAVFEHGSHEILAVLDWELATIGDPLSDLTYTLMGWLIPGVNFLALGDVDHESTGIPPLEAMIAEYQKESGIEELPQLNWYFAFNLFRTVGIIQGVKKRLIDGNASNSSARELIEMIPIIAKAGWKQARDAGAT